MTASVLTLLATCFSLALAAFFARPRASLVLSAVAIGSLLLFTISVFTQMGATPSGPLIANYVQDSISGLSISFFIDGLSLTFLALVAGIGVLVLIYGLGYFKGRQGEWIRCLGLLQLFIAGMVGLVSAGNLIFLFLFWELTTLSSYLLIGFDHTDPKVRNSALRSLLITSFGGLALLGGILLIGEIGGSFELVELYANAEAFRQSQLTTAAVVLVLLGCFTKSAQFPFHVWLPEAMAAPTPVSAYLHSATMVKAGVFLAARLSPLFVEVWLWHALLLNVGVVTALWGIVQAFRVYDLKQILAYTTISGLGILFALLGVGTEQAIEAALVFLIVHALYKAGLFMLAGCIDKTSGTRDIRELGGLLRPLPILAGSTFILCLSMAGVPPLIGFVAKELIYEATMALGIGALFMGVLGILAMALTVAVSFYFFAGVFISPSHQQIKIKRISYLMTIPPVLLAVLSFGSGIFPQPLADFILEPGVLSIMSIDSQIKLKLWHGFNLVLFASLATLFVGWFIGTRQSKVAPILAKIDSLAWLAPSQLYRLITVGFSKLCHKQSHLLFEGAYRKGLEFLVLGLGLTLIYILFNIGAADNLSKWGGAGKEIDLFSFLAFAMIILPALLVPFFRARVSAILIAGVTGLGISLLFVSRGAPDIAITQILVEVFVLLLFVYVVRRLPRVQQRLPNSKNIRAVGLALLGSVTISLTLYFALMNQGKRELASYFIDNSYSKAFGKNVVNVILVDFRAFDTLGEITVLAIATLGIVILVRTAKRRRDEISNS